MFTVHPNSTVSRDATRFCLCAGICTNNLISKRINTNCNIDHGHDWRFYICPSATICRQININDSYGANHFNRIFKIRM